MLDDDEVDLAEAAVSEPKWLIKNLLPVGLTILGAPPKSGKSLWSLIFAGLVAKWDIRALPESMSITPQDAGHTLIIPAEASPGSLRVDMEHGLRMPLTSTHEGVITVSDDVWRYFISLKQENPHEAIMNKIERYDEDGEFIGPKLLIIDPLIDFHDADENSAGQMIKVLKPLRDWAMKHDCAVLLPHHTGKPLAENRKNYEYGSLDLRGTSAIFGKADAVLVITTPGEGIVTPVKLRAIFKRGESYKSEIDLAVWNSKLLRGTEKIGDLDKMMVESLRSGLSKELTAQKLGMSLNDIEVRIMFLTKKGLI